MQHSEHLYKIAYRKYSSSKRGRIAILVAKKRKEGLEMEIDLQTWNFQALFQPQIQVQTRNWIN